LNAGANRPTPVTRHIEAPASKRTFARAFPFMPAADRSRGYGISCLYLSWNASQPDWTGPQYRVPIRLRLDQAATRTESVLINANKSALIVSAFVVGMPCGKPLYVFKIDPLINLALSGPESAYGTI
jgi:hypothetical protein